MSAWWPTVRTMSHTSTVGAYWAAADRRDWTAFGALLADDVVYLIQQTGERISGRERYLRFNAQYPGDWSIEVDRAIADPDQAVSWISFRVGGEVQTAVTFFRFDAAGLITEVVDFWPEPYDAPPRPDGVMDA